MKNILIISSSPRKKGNSQILCEQFKKGAEAKGHQVKIVRIMEQNIGFCRACDGCMRNGGTCVLKDDMAEILGMFRKADVLVLATPVYFYRYRGTPQGSVQARDFDLDVYKRQGVRKRTNDAEKFRQEILERIVMMRKISGQDK